MTTKERVKEIQDKIEWLNSELRYLRETCPHIDTSVEHIGSTGNFDPSDDGYEKLFKCKECGKIWREDV
jgi:hypothetical protein